MSAARRVPNQIKFKMVMSDRSQLEGVFACSDAQWPAILNILMNKPSPPDADQQTAPHKEVS